MIHDGKTIAAVATGSGGAIAIIRLSGSEAFSIADAFFRARNGVSVCEMAPFTISYGDFVASDGEVVDDLLLSKFVAPRSYTGEDMVEFSVHASEYIKSRILAQLITRGARTAQPGEYTLRAYVNGKMDMLGAEAVADIIASDSRAGHTLALSQMRGGYTAEFARLRGELVDLQSLLELELDFGEEDVEFADRSRLAESVDRAEHELTRLIDSYAQGSVIKEGVPVAIIGAPNSGKSTLLNALLNEERAIVSSIAGTTRDSIEETLRLGDVLFRFIDTAGMRTTDDPLESIGIERARQKAQKARVVLLTVDISDYSHANDLTAAIARMRVEAGLSANTDTVILLNKCDMLPAWPGADHLSSL
ncbi:MAG: tRNA uridine-5-carboxymethylaminomethyl(34) synthesis GTPase MnmE, partial [Rikenellaceae bacterium]|nr:tRNA uridine-5-carboxymethylaminomethyl(34) synthesis GTPase MnmE [Rikenellaceae bacterium]